MDHRFIWKCKLFKVLFTMLFCAGLASRKDIYEEVTWAAFGIQLSGSDFPLVMWVTIQVVFALISIRI